jgi:hypothetical protein
MIAVPLSGFTRGILFLNLLASLSVGAPAPTELILSTPRCAPEWLHAGFNDHIRPSVDDVRGRQLPRIQLPDPNGLVSRYKPHREQRREGSFRCCGSPADQREGFLLGTAAVRPTERRRALAQPDASSLRGTDSYSARNICISPVPLFRMFARHLQACRMESPILSIPHPVSDSDFGTVWEKHHIFVLLRRLFGPSCNPAMLKCAPSSGSTCRAFAPTWDSPAPSYRTRRRLCVSAFLAR